ncbi:hypothetical protein [Brucella tritici]|uniref:hypothetical protein n=1 Tax=Brucella tritici TaxID=94626 RepID=UPI001592AB40|nr:hypothetical protein [Brucella tritici]
MKIPFKMETPGSISTPTVQLRWRNGVLEQAFFVETLDLNNKPVDRQVEWRIVPIVDDTEAALRGRELK